VNRQLVTGAHVVADISCTICGTVLGWKYVDAKEASQKYKIGKFILETKKVIGFAQWEEQIGEEEEEEGEDVEWFNGDLDGEKEEDGVVVFDSEDEDECEDLFAGTWDATVVAKRRTRRLVPRRRQLGI